MEDNNRNTKKNLNSISDSLPNITKNWQWEKDSVHLPIKQCFEPDNLESTPTGLHTSQSITITTLDSSPKARNQPKIPLAVKHKVNNEWCSLPNAEVAEI